MKENILRQLRQTWIRRDCRSRHDQRRQVLALNPDGVFLSNGPGDPEALPYAHETIRGLIGQETDLRDLSRTSDARFRLWRTHLQIEIRASRRESAGERSASGKVAITSQNHGFAVDPESLPNDVEVSHVNLNDGTVEGMRHRELPIFSVQYHPEAAPGPHDASVFF